MRKTTPVKIVFPILVIILFTTLYACSKEVDQAELLLGSWRIKSQVDTLGTATGYIVYDMTNQKRLEFQSNGKVMTNGIVTPTWVFQPQLNTASYYLKNNIINIGDSSFINGSLYYLNQPMHLKIKFISKDLLVVQHMRRFSDPALITIDSLVRE